MGNGGNIVSLDDIIEYVLGDESGETPRFVRDNERKVKDGLSCYFRKIKQTDVQEPADEDDTGELLDCISGVNRTYMKMGMKLAAGMIFQLMGL